MADRAAIRPGSLRRRLTIAFLLVAGLSAAALAVASYAIVREARLSDSVDRAITEIMVAHGRIGDEIDALKRIGMTPTEALGAASWTARGWLGGPSLEHGAPADLVCYAEDPRTGAAVIKHPDVIVLRGCIY